MCYLLHSTFALQVRTAHTKAAQLEALVAEAQAQALASSQAGEQLGSNSAAQAAALAAASSKTGALEETMAVLEAHVETLKSEAAAAARKVTHDQTPNVILQLLA